MVNSAPFGFLFSAASTGIPTTFRCPKCEVMAKEKNADASCGWSWERKGCGLEAAKCFQKVRSRDGYLPRLDPPADTRDPWTQWPLGFLILLLAVDQLSPKRRLLHSVSAPNKTTTSLVKVTRMPSSILSTLAMCGIAIQRCLPTDGIFVCLLFDTIK